MKPQVTIETINKKRAEELLMLVPDYQRNLRNTRVEALVRAMATGQWELSGQAIIIGMKGNVETELIDGQHRLTARTLVHDFHGSADFLVLRKPLKLHPVTGIEVTYGVTDDGIKRSFVDYLKICGDTRYATLKQAVVNHLLYSDHHDDITMPFGKPQTGFMNPDRIRMYESLDKDLLDRACTAASSVRSHVAGGVSDAAIASMYYQAGIAGYEPAMADFIEQVKSGETPRGSGSRELREALMRWAAETTSRTPSFLKWKIIVKTWHKHLTGEPIKSLKTTGAFMPVVPEWIDEALALHDAA